MNKDLLGNMEQETLDLKCIKVVKDYLKQQVTMKCKGRNEKECTHIYNIRKKHGLESFTN
jgi:hypothetical protein